MPPCEIYIGATRDREGKLKYNRRQFSPKGPSPKIRLKGVCDMNKSTKNDDDTQQSTQVTTVSTVPDGVVNYDRVKEFNKTRRRLRKTFSDLEGHKKDVAYHLIDEIASINTEMDIMKAYYQQFGSVDELQQGDLNDGGYIVLRESPYFKNYINALKQFIVMYMKIVELYPKDEQKIKVSQDVDEMAELAKQFRM